MRYYVPSSPRFFSAVATQDAITITTTVGAAARNRPNARRLQDVLTAQMGLA
jgi:hypothetical protein